MATTRAGEACKVLLVEDHADTARVVVRVLRRLGYRVEVATDLAEARARAAADWPDVMLVDLVLPDGDGIDLVREMKAIRPVHAVAYTGCGTADDLRRTADAGFDGHVTKPATVEQLEAALRKACAAAA